MELMSSTKKFIVFQNEYNAIELYRLQVQYILDESANTEIHLKEKFFFMVSSNFVFTGFAVIIFIESVLKFLNF